MTAFRAASQLVREHDDTVLPLTAEERTRIADRFTEAAVAGEAVDANLLDRLHPTFKSFFVDDYLASVRTLGEAFRDDNPVPPGTKEALERWATYFNEEAESMADDFRR